MEAVLIGLDLGTTGCKSAVFDENLEMLGEAYIEYPLIRISSTEIEQDANLWWDLTRQVIKVSVQNSKINPSMIKGISVSSQGIAFVPVDENFNPIRNAISWLDSRSTNQRDSILGRFSEPEIFNTTGKRASESYVLPKLLWLRENEKDLYNRTHKFLMALDYITARLCGECFTDHSMASGTLLYDISKQAWSPLLLEEYGIDEAKLPEIKWSGSPVGYLSKEVADELGLPAKVVVALGGQDQKCAALGAGIGEMISTVSLGTASAIEQKCHRPVIDSNMRVPCFSYLFKNEWVIEGCVITAGASMRWLKETLFSDKSYKDLDRLALLCEGQANDVFFFPHLAGSGSPYWKSNTQGSFYGITLSTDANQIVKSVFEGVAYQIKANIEAMQEIYQPVSEIRLFGGGAKSDIWCRIISDITGKRITTLSTCETANVGAAILAGLGCGIFRDQSVAADKVRTAKVFDPVPKSVCTYREKYEEYLYIQDKFIR